jgi:hypothetical protein
VADQLRFSGRRVWSLMALLAIAASCIALAATPNRASAASNADYCWGVWLHYHNEFCQTGYVPYTYTLVGSGKQHSVCVWDAAGVTQCSPGPNQQVFNNSMDGCGTGCGVPSINNNGYDWNQVYGHWYSWA